MRNKLKEYIKGLYYITDEPCSNGKTNIETVKLMLEAGAKIIQYREKNKSMKDRFNEALEMRKMCNEFDCIFIVNDNIDLAIAVDADGVHIGQTDLPVNVVRKLLGDNKIIGLSTHNKEDANRANTQDIDYVGVGPIFDTPKKDYSVGFEYMEYAIKNINVPCVVIGGIKSKHIDDLVKRGATSICMVSEITSKSNIKEFVETLKI